MLKIKFKVPVVCSKKGSLLGVTSNDVICEKLTSYFVNRDESIKRCLLNEYKKLNIEERVNRLSRAFKRRNFVLIKEKKFETMNYYILTPRNLTDFILLDNKNFK